MWRLVLPLALAYECQYSHTYSPVDQWEPHKGLVGRGSDWGQAIFSPTAALSDSSDYPQTVKAHGTHY